MNTESKKNAGNDFKKDFFKLTVFPKTALLISLKKSFSKSFFASVLNLIFMSMYGFNQTF